MSFLYSILMGIIQGITEFLPVSSFGHLVIFQQLTGFEPDTGLLLEAMLHLGTMVAVVLAFQKDVRQVLLELCRMAYDVVCNAQILIQNKKNGEDQSYHRIVRSSYRKFVVLLLVSTIPTFFLGYAARNLAQMAASSLLFTGIGLLITGILLFVVDFIPITGKLPGEITYDRAMWIGICQGLSVFPGISRLGITMSTSLMFGMGRKFALKYSFLLSIPATLGAMAVELKNFVSPSMTVSLGVAYVLGAIVAGAVGYLCIRHMLSLVRKKRFRIFACYLFFGGTCGDSRKFCQISMLRRSMNGSDKKENKQQRKKTDETGTCRR